MNKPTKEQIARLSPEQQAEVAVLELRRAEKREHLLKRARGLVQRRTWAVVTAVIWLAIIGVGAWAQLSAPLLICLIALATMTESGFMLLNGRIDTLVDLYESDRHHSS